MQTDTLKLGGCRIEYRFVRPAADARGAGSGADIVMLHEGLGSTAMGWDFPDRLAAATGSRILVYSRRGYRRGYGRSTPSASLAASKNEAPHRGGKGIFCAH